MDILFPQSQLKSYQDKINQYINAGFTFQYEGGDLLFRYVQPNIELYDEVRSLQAEGIVFTGFPAYMRMSKTDYENNDVPVGVSYSQELDANGDPTGNQLKWNEWQPNPSLVKNDDLEVIIPTTYQSQPATEEDLEILETAADVNEIMSLLEFQTDYLNNIDWITDELGDPLPEPPIEKTALYYTMNWEAEAFDFLHAQRLVNQWFQGLTGATITDKFNTLTGTEKKEVIRWGVLGDASEGKGLIEATILNPFNRNGYRNWHVRRLAQARQRRFDIFISYMTDNLKNNAIVTRLQEALTYELKEFYIYRGASNQSNHLIVNGEINPTFWALFGPSDFAYSDVLQADAKIQVEKILDGNKFNI